MKKTILFYSIAALGLVCNTASAGTYEWTSGWGMGISEHLVDDGNSNSLNISCPNDEGAVSAYATINGKDYTSNDLEGFDVIVDGEYYRNPFFTQCNACSAAFPAFWAALRKANNLKLTADGITIVLSTKNIASVLMPLDSEENSCRTDW